MKHSGHLRTGAKNLSIVLLVVFVFVLPSIVSPVRASVLVKINSDNLSFGRTVPRSQIDSILAANSPESLISSISHISGSMIGTHGVGTNAFSELKSTLNN